MPRLHLLRHAHAASAAAGGDAARPLDERGRRQALVIGEFLRQTGVRFDTVLCSSAIRARETWEAVAERLPASPGAFFEEAIYNAGAEELLARLHLLPAEATSVIVIGHNPTLHQLGFTLTATSSGDALDRLCTDLPPGGLLALQFDGGWPSLAPQGAHLSLFMTPQRLV